jgi:signal peptidase I
LISDLFHVDRDHYFGCVEFWRFNLKTKAFSVGDIVQIKDEDLELVVFAVDENAIGVFPFYEVHDVDDRRWHIEELDWEVVGERPMEINEWYNPAARFDNDEAPVKYGVEFRRMMSKSADIEILRSCPRSDIETGDWILVDDLDQGLICGIVDNALSVDLQVHFYHHKCARSQGQWNAQISIEDVLLVDSTYRHLYKKCESETETSI